MINYIKITKFNETMKDQPIAPITYEPGSKKYYESLQTDDTTAKSIAATTTYELKIKNKFVTQFLDPWSTPAKNVVGTT